VTIALLLQPEPYKGESLRGFLIRTSEANLLESVSWIKNVPNESIRIKKMFETTLRGRVPKWLCEAWKPDEIPASELQRTKFGGRPRCCQDCLREAPYWRVEWEHALYSVCHHHGRLLHDRCPRCSTSLNWDRSELLRCSCKSMILDWPETSSARNEEVELCRHIARCILERDTVPHASAATSLTPILLPMSLNDVEALIVTFGAYGERYEVVDRVGPHRASTTNEAHTLVRVAANLLLDWPHRFNALLCRLGRYGQEDAYKHESPPQYNNFVRFVRNRFDTPGLAFVLTAYRHFVVENWHGTLNRRQKWAEESDLNAQRYIPAAVACKTLALSRTRLKKLLEQNVLRGYIKRTQNQRELIVIERSSLVNAESILVDRVTLGVAAKLLGLPKGRVCELVVGGLLPDVTLPSMRGDIRLFSRKEIAAFIKRLTAGRRESSDDEDLIAANVVLKTHLASVEEFRSLVSAVVNQEITTVSVPFPAEGFSGLAFARNEFYRWRAAQRMSLESTKLTVVEAATRLGVKQEVAYHLVRTELLPSSTAPLGKRRCRFVRAADIDVFRSTYISAISLASDQRTSPKSITKNLAAKGVLPIIGPGIDSCRQYFFRRRDVDRVFIT
jgi:hypothetical protein